MAKFGKAPDLGSGNLRVRIASTGPDKWHLNTADQRVSLSGYSACGGPVYWCWCRRTRCSGQQFICLSISVGRGAGSYPVGRQFESVLRHHDAGKWGVSDAPTDHSPKTKKCWRTLAKDYSSLPWSFLKFCAGAFFYSVPFAPQLQITTPICKFWTVKIWFFSKFVI